MKLLIVTLGILLISGTSYGEKMTDLKSEKDRISYSIGMDIGKNLANQSIEVNPDAMSQGIKDALTGEKLLLTDEEFRSTMEKFRQTMMEKQREKAEAAAANNKKAGEAFLVENKKKEGVKTLPSGLQYMVVEEGKGNMPKDSDTVTVHYKGTLIDGTEFDSSYGRGQPATFPVNGVIPGWTEALQLMKAGAKWKLFIPSDLAYGERGAGGSIGPNQTLIFDVELISIN